MTFWLRTLAGLAALTAAAAAPAQAPDDMAGVYVADLMETATALELGGDGRFVWMFSQGSLDVGAVGRWRREGDSVLLDSDPVTPPVFERVSTEPAPDRVVRVRFDAESRPALRFLDIELEYADGTRERDHFRGPGYPIPLDGPRRVAAFRIVSPAYMIEGERVPLPAEGTLLVYRFVANDLGLENFRGERLAVTDAGLRLSWRGTAMTYARVDAQLDDEVEAAMAAEAAAAAADQGELRTPEFVDVPLPPMPVSPWEVADGAPSLGRFDFEPGEPFAATAGRSNFALNPESYAGSDYAPGIVELSLRAGSDVHDLGRVSDLGWRLDDDSGERRIGALNFNPQDRMLALGEALARARALHDWLVRAGFTPGAPEGSTFLAFGLIDPYRYDQQASGWEEAATLLADEDQGIQGINLFMLRARGWYAQASVINRSRGESPVPIRTPGQEWIVEVELYRDTETMFAPAEDAE